MKWLFIITGVVLLIFLGVWAYSRFFYTKSFSPESNVNFKYHGLNIRFTYSRPYKKGRLIFGSKDQNALVPFGKAWRTGANEATVFETDQDLTFQGKKLAAGTYTFWTVPDEQKWTIIFNSEYGQWGVDYNGVSNRDPKNDVLKIEVPPVIQDKEFEQFTISVEKMGEDMEIILLWDKTLVSIPFSR